MAVNKIKGFIKDNGLSFDGTGSELNGNCVTLAGYACYLELSYIDFRKLIGELSTEAGIELNRVFDYAYENNYAEWWTSKEAKEQYTF